jgi:3-methyladenine DNA glycosylase/8-oxoguanine DNA glycosylase
MNAFSHVYVMKTVNRNLHSNEMRLTDRYNVQYCAHRFSQYGSTILFYLNLLNSDEKKLSSLKLSKIVR